MTLSVTVTSAINLADLNGGKVSQIRKAGRSRSLSRNNYFRQINEAIWIQCIDRVIGKSMVRRLAFGLIGQWIYRGEPTDKGIIEPCAIIVLAATKFLSF